MAELTYLIWHALAIDLHLLYAMGFALADGGKTSAATSEGKYYDALS